MLVGRLVENFLHVEKSFFEDEARGRRAPSLIKSLKSHRGGGQENKGPHPQYPREPPAINEEEDEKGASRTRAPSLMEDRTRRGPGGRGGCDPS